MKIWLYIRIIGQVLIVPLLPYVLVGALFRVLFPRVRANLLALLGAVATVLINDRFHVFRNLFSLSRLSEEPIKIINEKQFQAEVAIPFMIVIGISIFIGNIMIPFLLSRAGIALVDKVRHRKTQQGAAPLPSARCGHSEGER